MHQHLYNRLQFHTFVAGTGMGAATHAASTHLFVTAGGQQLMGFRGRQRDRCWLWHSFGLFWPYVCAGQLPTNPSCWQVAALPRQCSFAFVQEEACMFQDVSRCLRRQIVRIQKAALHQESGMYHVDRFCWIDLACLFDNCRAREVSPYHVQIRMSTEILVGLGSLSRTGPFS